MPDLAKIETLIANAGIPIESVKKVQGQIVLEFGAGATELQRSQANAIVLTYDDSAEVAREAARVTAQNALKGQAITAMLQAITDDSADIVADLVSVNGLAVLALVTMKPLLLRMLARQARMNARMDIVLKILSQE